MERHLTNGSMMEQASKDQELANQHPGDPELAESFLSFIEKSPSVYHVIGNIMDMLRESGFEELDEREPDWAVCPGGKYFVTRNHSSLLAFCVPTGTIRSVRAMVSHSDSPTFRIKPDPEMESAGCVRLNIEPYGGMLKSTWFDRPLTVAGRLLTIEPDGSLRQRLVHVDRDLLIIPSLAIHMDREANEKNASNVQNDMPPLFAIGKAEGRFRKMIAGAAGLGADPAGAERILGADLFLVNRTAPVIWGPNREFISSPRLDDLMCCYGTLQGFLHASAANGGMRGVGNDVANDVTGGMMSGAVNDAVSGVMSSVTPDPQQRTIRDTEGRDTSLMIFGVFDNEEVGSRTKQGAESTFFTDVMARLQEALGLGVGALRSAAARGMMISADNAHAVHPNHTEKADPVNRPAMNGGIVLKLHANQKYTTDGISEAQVRHLCQRHSIPLQTFVNRSDMKGGSTLGNILNSQFSISTADIGLAQLAMHSSYETAGTHDLAHLAAFSGFFYAEELPGITG